MTPENTTPEALLVQRQRMEAVWRERAHRLSRGSNLAGVAENAAPVVVLGLGNERYGIELADVAEVLPPVLPTAVPGAPAVFSGVVNVHGEIRPVIDLRRLLGIAKRTEPARNGDIARVILLRKDGRELGLQVDTVEQIRWIASGHLATRDNSAPVTGSAHIKGSTRDLLMLLSTETLFAELASG
jgi:purine-binding chemotaxis protein CheW